MKINLGQKLKSRQKIKKIIGFSFLVFFVFFLLNFLGYAKNIKNFFFSVSSPFQKVFWQTGRDISDFSVVFFGTESLGKELTYLRLENHELLGQIVELSGLTKENEILRKALEIGLEKEFKLISARVISKDIFRDSLLINKGKKDGVLEGRPVITEEKVLLGKIGQVYDGFSEVILVSNKESSFDGKIIFPPLVLKEKNENENGRAGETDHYSKGDEIYGMVRGKGGLKLYFDLIPKEKQIFREDLVVTSVLGGIYPEGLLVGRIKEIRKSDIETFQEAEIDPIFEISGLDYLFIIVEF